MTKFAVIVLAAGGSTRLGVPKQLVRWQGQPLVRRAAQTAIDSGAADVIVVVGADADPVCEALAGLAVRVIVNPDWAEGMGSSIRAGAQALTEETQTVVIMLCDQPFVTAEHLAELAACRERTGSAIAASSYDGIAGAPAAFGAVMFPSLTRLTGDTGARQLIRSAGDPVVLVPCFRGNLDVDTPEDLRRLGDGG